MEQDKNIRPWGRYDVLEEETGFKVKRIAVAPGQRLSYQQHARRSEFWTIVAGEALVTQNDKQTKKIVGETVTVPIGMKHRIQNIGSTTVIFIEVQIGDYLGEDDIKRFADDYGRAH